MVAKIGHGERIEGALSYNQLKVAQGKAGILFTHRMIETTDGNYSVAWLSRSFEPYLSANRRTEKPVLHISLNPDPKDKVSDEDFREIAQQYMCHMGYANQPFVVYKHTDTERTHIHIVSVCVDEEGRKIPDAFERRRSMDICRLLEQQYNLLPGTESIRKQDDKIFQPVNYSAGDIKSQISSVVRHLPGYYQFGNFGSYNALLSLFNITAEEIKGDLHGKTKEGLVYFALDEQGAKASNPFKASLFGRMAGYAQLQMHYEQSKENLKAHPVKAELVYKIREAKKHTSNEVDFKALLSEQGIHVVVRRSAQGRLYGITFIDHRSKTVWNGSMLGKDFSANVFNRSWSGEPARQASESKSAPLVPASQQPEAVLMHPIFDFLDNAKAAASPPEGGGLAEALFALLPRTQNEDYAELTFANRMKRKKKKRRPGGQ